MTELSSRVHALDDEHSTARAAHPDPAIQRRLHHALARLEERFTSLAELEILAGAGARAARPLATVATAP